MMNRIFYRYRLIILMLLVAASMLLHSCDRPSAISLLDNRVKTGSEVLLDNYLDELEGLSVGLVMNPTSRIGDTHMLDTLLSHGVNVRALFAPEHGFRGEAGAGDLIEDNIDTATGLPVYSLYGTTRKPNSEMLSGIDLLLFDIQDVGARFYTYIATLGLVMEAAADNEVDIWVLDRPNPLGGNYVSGWTLEEEFESFVGPYPIPVAHGLTIGEMAMMIAGEGWMDSERKPELRVIKMEGWKRLMKWPDTGLEWIPPSPNLPAFDNAFFYPGAVFFEGTTLSEGRGTDNPFLTLGSPQTDLDDMDWDELSLLNGVHLLPHSFTPQSIPGVASNPKHEGEQCRGLYVELHSYQFDPVRTGLKIFATLMEATPDAEVNPFLYRLAGTRKIDRILTGELDPVTLDFEIEPFLRQREPYLIYK
ncbi:exo-beta-N-acetylmuramidase NamZ family protein [Rhodohalobacter mucosus]|nr:DUF1343 domain-containing protein [Rhodohalobacter mucosus]